VSDLTPINYSTTIYPFGEPGLIQSNNWVLWDSDALNPLTISFDSSLSVKSIWIPQLTGPVTFYAGDTATGTPFYVSGGAGSELVPVLVDTLDVTMTGSGGDMYVYYTSLVLDPFRQGVIGNQVTSVTATLPVLSSGGTTPNISLQVPLAIGYGGTGTATPVGVTAAPSGGILVTGSFPDQTLSFDFSGIGVVTAVTASSPLSSTGGATPNISLTGTVGLGHGGTGQTSPALNAGPGISVTGTIFQPTGGSAWTVNNIGVTSLSADSGPTETGDLTIAGGNACTTTASGSTITIDVEGGKFGLPIVYQSGGSIGGANPHIVIDETPVAVPYTSGSTIGSTTVNLSGAAQFPSNNYSVAVTVANATGSPPIVVMSAASLSSTSFVITGYASGGSGAGNINCHFIAIGS